MKARAAALLAAFSAGALGVTWWTVSQTLHVRSCPAGLVAGAKTCCLPGQTESLGLCVGSVTTCSGVLTMQEGQCVARTKRVAISGGVVARAADWEAPEPVWDDGAKVAAFTLDETESTIARYQGCVRAGQCRALHDSFADPGLPVSGLSFDDAKTFCAFEKGRLPTVEEWVLAASGPLARRYPWGMTGAVCRREAWGLSHGPCATEGIGPDRVGLHVEGATPEGVQNLGGNLSEWVTTRSGAMLAGGCYTDAAPIALRTWNVRGAENLDISRCASVRCAYDSAEPDAASP